MLRLEDVNDDGILIAAGGYAILMQLADRAVAAGVARHSDFTERPGDRLRQTLVFLYAVSYGTPAQRDAVTRSVNRAHAPVRDHNSPATYSAFDPHLQLWVAATLCEAGMRMHELVWGPLDAASADTIQRQYAVIGDALQVPAGMWPQGMEAFRDYWATAVGELSVTPEARTVARALLRPARVPLWMRPLMPLGRLVTAGMMEPRLREAFGFRWSAMQQRRYDRAVTVARVVWPRVPRLLRTLPKRHLLATLDAHAGERTDAGR